MTSSLKRRKQGTTLTLAMALVLVLELLLVLLLELVLVLVLELVLLLLIELVLVVLELVLLQRRQSRIRVHPSPPFEFGGVVREEIGRNDLGPGHGLAHGIEESTSILEGQDGGNLQALRGILGFVPLHLEGLL